MKTEIHLRKIIKDLISENMSQIVRAGGRTVEVMNADTGEVLDVPATVGFADGDEVSDTDFQVLRKRWHSSDKRAPAVNTASERPEDVEIGAAYDVSNDNGLPQYYDGMTNDQWRDPNIDDPDVALEQLADLATTIAADWQADNPETNIQDVALDLVVGLELSEPDLWKTSLRAFHGRRLELIHYLAEIAAEEVS